MVSDPTKIRKKKAAPAEDADGKSPVLAGILSRAQANSVGRDMLTRASALNTLIGLPTPALSVAWLIQCNVIPFSRLLMLVGPPGSGKSSVMADLMRQVLDLHGDTPIPGAVHYNENEAKPSLSLFWAILENRPDLESVVSVAYTTYMEDWQRQSALKFKEWASMYDPAGKDKYGWVVPLFLGTDSLMATGCLATCEGIEEEGHAKRGFPADALVLSTYAKSLPRSLGNRPVLFVATNHLKEMADPNNPGQLKRNVPGGEAFKFMESLELEMRRVKDIRTNRQEGMVVRVKAHKNCVGTSRRSIEVPFVWEYDAEEEIGSRERRQWAMFDWQGASINLIRAIKAKDRARWDRIDAVVDVHDGRNQNLAWSNTLGVPSSDQVTNHELGCLLEERPDLLEALYPILDIRQGRFFYIGMDYQAMRADREARPDPQELRRFRRPACGDLSRRYAAGAVDVSADINMAGFEVD